MTKPDDTPQDVHDAVEAIMALVDAGADLSTEQRMARAILAERERCAKVADAERIEPPLDCEEDEAYNLAIDHVIAAIRSGT